MESRKIREFLRRNGLYGGLYPRVRGVPAEPGAGGCCRLNGGKEICRKHTFLPDDICRPDDAGVCSEDVTLTEEVEPAPYEVVEGEAYAGSIRGRSARYRTDQQGAVLLLRHDHCRAHFPLPGPPDTHGCEDDIPTGISAHEGIVDIGGEKGIDSESRSMEVILCLAVPNGIR
jgi:hypothetical protein